MKTFEDLNLTKPLLNALDDMGIEQPTPIQEETFSVILSGKDVVGLAQTGTGKTLAYLLPLLRDLKFSEQLNPRILIVVPTRELVQQVEAQAKALSAYTNTRVLGVYGGTNINTQKLKVVEGMDVLVATPGRLYDLVLHKALTLKDVKKLVIDEMDVMLDLGFKFQITNILELLPTKRQHLLFSATMTEDVDEMILDYFGNHVKVSVAASGEPLKNIEQSAIPTKNFYTKANLLMHLLKDKETYHKVMVFLASKKNADRLFLEIEESYLGDKSCIIHSNKSQNYRERSVRQFDEGRKRLLIATDVMARGLDMEKVSHVINFDTPTYPENYIHRIGRTGRAENPGKSILFYTEKEEPYKEAIEKLMDYTIPHVDFPEYVEIAVRLTPEEKPKRKEINVGHKGNIDGPGPAFHEKKEKNRKENWGGSYKRKVKKHKSPKTRGQKPSRKKR